MREKLSKQEKRLAWRWAVLIVVGMAALAALIWWAAGWEIWQEKGTLPPESDAVLAAATGMDSITVDAAFDPERKQLTATQTLILVNRWAETLDHVTLRSYSGAYLAQETSPAATDELFDSCYGRGFSTGGLLMDSASANGESVQYAWEDDARTVLTLPLGTPWAPGESLTVQLTYHVHIPYCASRFGVDEGIWALGNVFPTLAVREDGAWRTDAYISIGDPFLSECANWVVRLTLPKTYRVAATGYAEPVATGDKAVYTFEAKAVRDFALVISEEYEVVTGMAGDTMLIACARERGAAREMLRYAQQAMTCFEAHYGPYVYPTLTLAETSFPFSGMEYPRMVMIGASTVKTAGQTLEFAVAHETAHQWWYAMVGSDPWNQAWQDESLCEYALMDYIGQYYGAANRDNAIYQRIETALRITIPRSVTPGSPIDYFSDLTEYSQVVYRRGAALWIALETHLGKDGLDAALKDYQSKYRFAIATREELTQLLSDHAGQDLTALMADYLDTHID